MSTGWTRLREDSTYHTPSAGTPLTPGPLPRLLPLGARKKVKARVASGLGEQEPPPAQSFTALSTHSQFIHLCSGSHFYKFFENFTGYALITHRTPLTPCAPPPPPHPPGSGPSSSFFPFPSLREPGNAKCVCSTRDHHDPPPSSQGPTAVQPAAKPSSPLCRDPTQPASVKALLVLSQLPPAHMCNSPVLSRKSCARPLCPLPPSELTICLPIPV